MIRILQGDCRDVLPTLEAGSVQCVVCSPPYFGLRDYGTGTWEGGDLGCDHRDSSRQGATRRDVLPEYLARRAATYGTGTGAGSNVPAAQYRDICGKCGATRVDRQIGLEASPEEYIATLVAVFRDVRRVLRADGCLFLNLGDSYAGGGGGNYTKGTRNNSGENVTNVRNRHDWLEHAGAKPKDLLMIPARVALALQSDGWWVRSDIIWHKVAPMPESVTDRCTRAHEYVFMLTKAARYFYNAAEARDPLLPTSVARLIQPTIEEQAGSDRANGGAKTNGPMKAVAAHFGGRIKSQVNDQTRLASGNEWTADPGSGANWRDVWPIASEGFAEGHFAVMPSALAERCIRAGSRPGDTVLDPFAGAATTLMVADRLQRHAIGIELNAEYVAMARARITKDAGMFAEIADAP